MPYLYKNDAKNWPRDRRIYRIPVKRPDEGLTGYVHGLPASDLEERYARALDAIGVEYQFQFEVMTAYTLPGEQKKVDFLTNDQGVRYPEEVDAAFVHKTAEQRGYDRVRDAVIDAQLSRYGYMPVSRIDGDRLQTQEAALTVAQERHG